jgi:hypothetical protein
LSDHNQTESVITIDRNAQQVNQAGRYRATIWVRNRVNQDEKL